MRIDIPHGTDPGEALARARGRKIVGRKHNHQPRGRAIERRKLRMKRRQAELVALRQKFHALVAAYWRGELEGHP